MHVAGPPAATAGSLRALPRALRRHQQSPPLVSSPPGGGVKLAALALPRLIAAVILKQSILVRELPTAQGLSLAVQARQGWPVITGRGGKACGPCHDTGKRDETDRLGHKWVCCGLMRTGQLTSLTSTRIQRIVSLASAIQDRGILSGKLAFRDMYWRLSSVDSFVAMSRCLTKPYLNQPMHPSSIVYCQAEASVPESEASTRLKSEILTKATVRRMS